VAAGSKGGFGMKNKKQWDFFKDNSTRLIGVMAANLVTNILPGVFEVILYLLIVQLTLAVLTDKPVNWALLVRYCWWYGGAFLLYVFFSMGSQTLNYVQAYTISSDLRLKLGEKLRKFSLRFFKENDPGDVAARLLGDVQKAELIIARILPDLVAAIIAPAILGVFLAWVNAGLTKIIIVSVIIAGIFLIMSRKIIGILGQKHVQTVVEASSRILEYCRTVKLLKSYNMTGERFATMDQALLRLKRISFRAEVLTAIPIQIFLFCLDAGYLVMLWAAVRGCATGGLSVQNLIAFAVIGHYFYEAVKSLGPMLVELGYVSISTKRIGEILKTEEPSYNELKDLPAACHINFDNVYFGYGGQDVLKGISCDIPERALTALVGMSGSGKTTLTSLIARFWDVRFGTVRLGGVPVTELEPDKLLSQLSMVFQDVYLFNDTIANNIRVGKKNASMEEIKRAAKLACCDRFIADLPDGYDTLVSEGGSSLSGGEKQRLSIARAILKDAPIVILDEATASLDPENEAEIQQAFENLVRKKTIIVIAHQFKAIEHADQILVLDGGTIVERGTHDQLLESGGLYWRLWREQQRARGWKMKTVESPGI
jgi:ATP-binding cassette subfamily B protein